MAPIRSFRDLQVWQLAMDLVTRCYDITRAFPSNEQFGLALQIRRASVSIPSNIAEGFIRRSRRAYANHVTIALGSHAELDTQLEIAGRTGLVTGPAHDEIQPAIDSVGRLLHGLVRALDRDSP